MEYFTLIQQQMQRKCDGKIRGTDVWALTLGLGGYVLWLIYLYSCCKEIVAMHSFSTLT